MTSLRAGRWTNMLRGAAGALALAGTAWGQAQPQPAEAAAEASRNILARSVARLALYDLRATVRPTDSDYSLAESLLEIARTMRPNDADLLRRQIEAAYAAGDQARVMELTRTLLATPSGQNDTVAILRLISASIAANTQTAEERLAAYDAFITGPKGKAFGDDIKSRLALDAALLLRERGDTEGFAAKLKQAVTLDRTHKEAALLAATFFSEQMPGDRVGRLVLLQNLLLADPVDPNVHFSIARELAAGRAFKAASRFHQNGLAIVAHEGPISADLDLERRVLQWNTQGATVMAQDIRQQLAAEKSRANNNLKAAIEAGANTEKMPKPEEIALPMRTATALALASDAAGDRDGVRAALNEITVSLSLALKGIDEAVRMERLRPEQAQEGAAMVTIALEQARLWTGQNLEEARKDVEGSPGLRERRPDDYRNLQGWLALRTDDAPRAIELLGPRASVDATACVGLGLAQQALGRTDEAAETFQRAIDLAPLGAEGAWARAHLQAMGKKDDAAQVAALERAVEGTPLWVDDMIVAPWKYVDMKVAVAANSGESGDDIPVRITLQNLSPVPLALGPDRPLNSRILMVPRLDNRAPVVASMMQPEVVDIDRRLRLMPRDAFTVEVNPDLGQTGWVIEALAGRPVRLRWRGVQGFQLIQNGGFEPGVMCVSAESDATTRRPVVEASLTPEELGKRIAAASSAELPRLAMLARWMVFDPLFFPRAADAPAIDLTSVGQSLAARYAGLPPVERACVATLAPHAGLSPAMAPLDEAMKAEQHPLPLSIILVTRVAEPGDAVLARAAGSPDESLRAIAARVAERLGAKDKLYFRMTPDTFKPPAPSGGAPGDQAAGGNPAGPAGGTLP